MTAWYNEIDREAAAWLRELISRGLIAPGVVDERDIRDVSPADLEPYTQCHFFAGIGTWSYALRCAGWPDDRPVWTGSPPCQPFSAAGRRGGVADERHLWPHYHHLIGIRRPGEVFIEQVASKDGLAWLDLVQADMEGSDYAYWASDLCAAGFGAPHIRQRQYGVGRALERMGNSLRERLEGHRRNGYGAAGWTIEGRPVAAAGADGGMANDRSLRRDKRITGDTGGQEGARCEDRALADRRGTPEFPGPVNGFWRDADWLGCRDDKWRPVRPGSFPLAHGSAPRMVCMCADCGSETRRQDKWVCLLWGQSSGHEGCESQEILRQGVLSSASTYCTCLEQEHGTLSSSQSGSCGDVQSLRPDDEFARSPHRRGPDERCCEQSTGVVQEVPCCGAHESSSVDVRSVRDQIYSKVSSEPEQDLFCPVCQRMGTHFCEEEVGRDRVPRLRGFGNGVVAAQAQGFIECYLDAEAAGFDLALGDRSVEELLG